MPVKIVKAGQRTLLTRLFLDMARGVATMYLNDPMYGSRADEVILCCCIFIGQAERKFMNASDLAEYAGIPRATTLRKLEKLKKRGLVSQHGDRFSILNAAPMNSDAMLAFHESVTRQIHRTSALLLKMDS